MSTSHTIKVKLVGVAKDEGAYLARWIHHHLYFGFNEIEIYINRTSDNSHEIVKKISNNYPAVKAIDADRFDCLPEFNSNRLQHESYLHALKSGRGSDYVMFLDIDEYWVTPGLDQSISDFIEEQSHFDAMVFEWFNEGGVNDEFQAFEKIVYGKLHQLGKSLIKMPSKIKDIRLHVSEMNPDSVIVLADGTKFKCEDEKKLPQHVSKDINSLKKAFVLHRMHRSEPEYLSSLFRGNPEQQFPIKLNRLGFGYAPNDPSIESIEFDRENYQKLGKSYDSFVAKCDLKSSIESAEQVVLKNAENLKYSIGELIQQKPEAVRRVLKYVKDKDISAVLGCPVKVVSIGGNEYKRKVVVHAGAHKTGTTSIQHGLFKSRNKLKAEGVVYATFDDRKSNQSILMHDAFLGSAASPRNVRALSQSDIDNLECKVIGYLNTIAKDDSWHTLIISGESISTLTQEMLSRFFSSVKRAFSNETLIECVFVVRNPCDYFRSTLQERLKRDSLEHIFSSGFPEESIFKNTIQKLAVTFKNEIKVLDFDTLVKEEYSLPYCFLKEVSGRFSDANFNYLKNYSRVGNQSMSSETFEFLNFINARYASSEKKQQLFHDARPLFNIAGLKPFSLPEEIKRKIEDKSQSDINYLNCNHGMRYSSQDSVGKQGVSWTAKNIKLFSWAVVDLPLYLREDAARFLEEKRQCNVKGLRNKNRAYTQAIKLITAVNRAPRWLCSVLCKSIYIRKRIEGKLGSWLH
ncbi:glycosyltransferase family 2 protein [Reinekea marinisedimentorum]|uniref:Glycosyl transferase family 2 n=1 Tax=Reinekea marinisedimentorum TaxID=230495 RepID=A0A4R3I7Y7_9GAMM|nr:glycosyltransferase family 2 protein [Reinekea marinisedimentorum]TCS41931.1 glycosyl transferase family 2 [Reinekea marinisedimentorum]